MFTPDPQKILIVDDSKTNIQTLGEALKEYNCIAATTGENALRIAKGTKKPDLILLDIVMKGMDGYEVCKILKEDSSTSEIPVIFITSKSDPESLVKGFGVGAVDFIAKPFHFDELRVRVSTQLKYKKSLDNNSLYLKSIEEIYDTITDSIYYAQKIQQATLPHDRYLNQVLKEYFVFYKPRDIVSGDFYFVNKIGNKLLLIAADCTGHGVPGALMSMMSMAFINEIINLENKYEPHEILNQLRTNITSAFNSDGNEDISDGLDASIVLIDPNNDCMDFAGANRPIYLVRNHELIEFKGDRMPVGLYPSQKPFTKQRIKLSEGDCIYMFSDGFADQFGGADNRKMMLGNFKQALSSNSFFHMKEQKKLLSEYFYEWMGHNEQLDDVLLLGYRYLK
ncbi:response regulator [Labilibacter sediminis]|nr:response regulator [Labilibacter sediminis]